MIQREKEEYDVDVTLAKLQTLRDPNVFALSYAI